MTKSARQDAPFPTEQRRGSRPLCSRSVILSDRTIREQLEAGRIGIDPLGPNAVQPSSVDIRLDNSFRVFLNHTRTVIDVKEDLTDLTQQVDIDEGEAFILHPGEFVLASTREVVSLPDDIVARIEGKSSLARLGLLIHSSLPGSEPVYTLEDGRWVAHPIEEVVRKQLRGHVVAFDPDTFEVGYHAITGWFEGPADKIYEIELASGRRVNVTAGHNLFTLDREGELAKVRTGALAPGTMVAIPRRLPTVPASLDVDAEEIRVAEIVPEPAPSELTLTGPAVDALIAGKPDAVDAALRAAGYASTASYYRKVGRLPFAVAREFPPLIERLTTADRFGWRGGTNSVPALIDVDDEFAWALGMYVAKGYRRRTQLVISNTDAARLDRISDVFQRIGLPSYRSDGAITVCSAACSALFDWLGVGGKSPTKRVPPSVFSWPRPLIESFLTGLVDGDGSFDGGRTSIWTTSDGLVSDILLLFALLGRRAGSCRRPERGGAMRSWQVYAPDIEHKLLASVPLPDQLLIDLRRAADLTQADVARRAGYRHPTDVCNIERRTGRDAVRRPTLERLRDVYRGCSATPAFDRLDRLVDGDLAWDRVVAVRDTGRVETIYDIEVRPSGRKVENFLAGHGGVFVSNTAGFIDPGFSGHITLELANVATLPITLYPGMKIGQISFMTMTTPADVPYGSPELGSKYHGQRGPTPSRYFENFERDAEAE
jgi:deoxycytidine triphosphate deaminase/intein/homing endonuclease